MLKTKFVHQTTNAVCLHNFKAFSHTPHPILHPGEPHGEAVQGRERSERSEARRGRGEAAAEFGNS